LPMNTSDLKAREGQHRIETGGRTKIGHGKTKNKPKKKKKKEPHKPTRA